MCFTLFFFQAEDGIRDGTVTGVQTCALPISLPAMPPPLCQRIFPRLSRISENNTLPRLWLRLRLSLLSPFRHGLPLPRSSQVWTFSAPQAAILPLSRFQGAKTSCLP